MEKAGVLITGMFIMVISLLLTNQFKKVQLSGFLETLRNEELVQEMGTVINNLSESLIVVQPKDDFDQRSFSHKEL